MKNRIKTTLALAMAGLLFAGCRTQDTEPRVEGNYAYEHSFNYDLHGNHCDVHETGTMDFYADSSALDSARQVYTVTFADGDTATIVFNYISPSRWHLDGKDFHFAGIKDRFRMEVIEGEKGLDFAQKIIDIYSASIDHETTFHLDTLTADRLQWSLTYRDGHSDTWEFFRQ